MKKEQSHPVGLEDLVSSKHNNVVAAEPGDDGKATLFLRKDGKLTKQEISFRPFLLLSIDDLLKDTGIDCEITKLGGNGIFSYLAKFANIADHDAALAHLKKVTGVNPSAPSSPYRVFSDFTQQLMISEKFRLFRGMTFREIRRLQFDIETLLTEGYEFPNAAREGDAISLISMSDNTGWEKSLVLGEPYSEKELLEKFVETILERDPDVIEGYNVFRFDLQYIEERAKRHKVKLKLGRNGSLIRSRASRLSVAERTISYRRYDIYGRHIIDVYHLVQFYDIIHRDLEEYGLKSVAAQFGVSPKNRTYIEGADICGAYYSNRKKLIEYGLDDVRETRALADILSPSYFYQTQLIPYTYQNCVVRGNATRIDAMLVSGYLDAEASVSAPQGDRPFSGGLTEAIRSGVFENVWHCDVRSLYPSIILAEKWNPQRDYLGVFSRLLKQLREFRLSAKDAEKSALYPEDRDYYNSLQTTFKILINSFYGYLGFSQGTFNDFNLAEAVTTKGREILTTMKNSLEKSGANVIEMDTDGIYFQPPAGMKNPEDMEREIQKVLPRGIDVELDSVYPSMFCYKSKNYALLKEDGEIAITGAALKSRGLEPFQRGYMKEFITLLLKEDFEGIEKLTLEYKDAIQQKKWPVAKFAKTETLQDSPDSYRRGIADGGGKRSAAYELAIKSGRDYRQGDQISFYVTGNKKNVSVVDNSKLLRDAPPERDENIPYYLSKLDELYKKFSVFIPNSQKADKDPGLGIL